MLDDIFEIFKMIFAALKIFFRIIEIFFIIVIGLIIFYPEKKYNMTYTINEDYIIQKEGIIEDEKVEMLSSDYSNEDHESVCFYVDLLK